MKDSEKGHFDAEEHRWDTNFDVGGLNPAARLDCTGAGQERDDDGLPETEEDDEFDGHNLEEGFVLGHVLFGLVVELNDAIHGDRDSDTFDNHDPNVGKGWIQGFQTISLKMLSDDGRDGHGDTNEAILEDCDPDDVEPSQARARGAQPAILPTGAFLEILHGPNPRLGLDGAEILFLVVQILRQVGAHQTEEGGDGKGFVAVSQDFVVGTVSVEDDGEEGDEGVNGDHKEDAYYMALFFRTRISNRMHEHEGEGDNHGNDTAYG